VRAASNPGTGTTTTGQTIEVVINTPVDGLAPGSTLVTGKVSIGLLGTNLNVVYVIDVSGSTSSGAATSGAGDCNGDGAVNSDDDINRNGRPGQVIDCEIAGVLALNNALKARPGAEVGAVAFASTARALDVNPGAGQQDFTTPGADNDADGVPDLETVVRALDAGGGTNFDAALSSMNQVFSGQPASQKRVGVFLSDGAGRLTTGSGSPLADAVNAGIVVNTVAVGTGSAGCLPGSGLRTIADMTGGTCTDIQDPSQLPAALANLGGGAAPGLQKVQISVNGGAPIDATFDSLGNFQATVTGIIVGANRIVVTATTDDASTATADVTVNALAVGGVPVARSLPSVRGVLLSKVGRQSSSAGRASSAKTVAGELPVTGRSFSVLLWSGLLLILAGGAMVVLTSRRRAADLTASAELQPVDCATTNRRTENILLIAALGGGLVAHRYSRR
jgi:LPXTG-motif cell wall-anchored protein